MFQIEISAEFLNGVAKFHIFVVIGLVIFAERFEHFYALLVAVRTDKACKKRDVFTLIQITHEPHKDCLIPLIFGKHFHKHFARLAFESVDFAYHIVQNRLAVFHKILVRFQSLRIGLILVEHNVEHLQHFFFGFIVVHLLLRTRFCSICQTLPY